MLVTSCFCVQLLCCVETCAAVFRFLNLGNQPLLSQYQSQGAHSHVQPCLSTDASFHHSEELSNIRQKAKLAYSGTSQGCPRIRDE